MAQDEARENRTLGALRRRDELPAFRRRAADRLFHEQMAPGLERGHAGGEMEPVGKRDNREIRLGAMGGKRLAPVGEIRPFARVCRRDYLEFPRMGQGIAGVSPPAGAATQNQGLYRLGRHRE